MTKPQQPELGRSDRTPLNQGAEVDTGDNSDPGESGHQGRIPEDNRPGHHPEREQDKPVQLGGAGHGTNKKKD